MTIDGFGWQCLGFPRSSLSVAIQGVLAKQAPCRVAVPIWRPRDINLNFHAACLRAGEWGRVPGTQALASAGKILTQMGIKVIRQGGSFADGSYCEPEPPPSPRLLCLLAPSHESSLPL